MGRFLLRHTPHILDIRKDDAVASLREICTTDDPDSPVIAFNDSAAKIASFSIKL